jgi:type I restriction enzyme S subunit
MKETGIDWMPEVPEHWEMRKIRRIFDGMSSGTTPESGNMKYYENGQTNWINTGDLNDGLLTYCKYKVTKRALEDYPTLKIYPIGTILVAMYGATIGKVSLMEIEGCTNQACCALYDSKIYIKEFSLFSLLAAKDALIRESYGGGQPNISQDVIKRFKLPVPPSEEQKQIVEHIISETKTLDIAISKAEREIELIKEYRENEIIKNGKI